MFEHHTELARDPSASLELLSREAASWGGRWSPQSSSAGPAAGRLELPVLAGLRHGWVEGPVIVKSSGGGSRLTFRVERSDYRLHTTSVTVLSFAGLGALVLLVAPFVPALWPLVPIGILLAVGAWLFIVARLRNSGPEEFLETLAQLSRAEAAEGDGE